MLKKNENVVARRIHGTFFLFDITEHYTDDKCFLYELNETGMFIWTRLDEAGSVEEITALLKNEIIDDIDVGVIREDVLEFIESLKCNGFVYEEDGNG